MILCTSIPGKFLSAKSQFQKLDLLPLTKFSLNFICIVTPANICCNPKHTLIPMKSKHQSDPKLLQKSHCSSSCNTDPPQSSSIGKLGTPVKHSTKIHICTLLDVPCRRREVKVNGRGDRKIRHSLSYLKCIILLEVDGYTVVLQGWTSSETILR